MSFEEFKILILKWNKEVSFFSLHRQMMQHPAYEQIKSLDKETAIRYTCLMLDGSCTHQCFIVLGELVEPEKRPPFDKYYAGRVPVMIECWKYWALHENIVSTKYDENGYWVEDKYGNRGNWS